MPKVVRRRQRFWAAFFPGTSRGLYLPDTAKGWGSLLLLWRHCLFLRLIFRVDECDDDGKAWADCLEWRAYEDEPGLLLSICLGGYVSTCVWPYFYFSFWFHSLESSFLPSSYFSLLSAPSKFPLALWERDELHRPNTFLHIFISKAKKRQDKKKKSNKTNAVTLWLAKYVSLYFLFCWLSWCCLLIVLQRISCPFLYQKLTSLLLLLDQYRLPVNNVTPSCCFFFLLLRLPLLLPLLVLLPLWMTPRAPALIFPSLSLFELLIVVYFCDFLLFTCIIYISFLFLTSSLLLSPFCLPF
jgi:hypothetical protein